MENDVNKPVELAAVPFVSPAASTRKSKRKLPPVSSKKGGLGVDELLQVFLELEKLDDKHLRSAVVFGRKRLQTLASAGTTHTEVIEIITIADDDDDETPMSEVFCLQAPQIATLFLKARAWILVQIQWTQDWNQGLNGQNLTTNFIPS